MREHAAPHAIDTEDATEESRRTFAGLGPDRNMSSDKEAEPEEDEQGLSRPGLHPVREPISTAPIDRSTAPLVSTPDDATQISDRSKRPTKIHDSRATLSNMRAMAEQEVYDSPRWMRIRRTSALLALILLPANLVALCIVSYATVSGARKTARQQEASFVSLEQRAAALQSETQKLKVLNERLLSLLPALTAPAPPSAPQAPAVHKAQIPVVAPADNNVYTLKEGDNVRALLATHCSTTPSVAAPQMKVWQDNIWQPVTRQELNRFKPGTRLRFPCVITP